MCGSRGEIYMLIRHKKTICHSQDILESLSDPDQELRVQGEKERRKAVALGFLPSVKDMPEHDPDGEIVGLTLTIPSWNSSIDRVFDQTNLREISERAISALKKELMNMRDSIELVLLAIEEMSDNERNDHE